MEVPVCRRAQKSNVYLEFRYATGKNRYALDFKTEEDITNLKSALGLSPDLLDEDYREHEN